MTAMTATAGCPVFLFFQEALQLIPQDDGDGGTAAPVIVAVADMNPTEAGVCTLNHEPDTSSPNPYARNSNRPYPNNPKPGVTARRCE